MALCISSFPSCHWSVVFDAFTVAFSFQPFFSFDSSQPFSLTSFGNGAGSSALPPLSTTL
jgi:hypothetical protein